jgi:hypothetical protein
MKNIIMFKFEWRGERSDINKFIFNHVMGTVKALLEEERAFNKEVAVIKANRTPRIFE